MICYDLWWCECWLGLSTRVAYVYQHWASNWFSDCSSPDFVFSPHIKKKTVVEAFRLPRCPRTVAGEGNGMPPVQHLIPQILSFMTVECYGASMTVSNLMLIYPPWVIGDIPRFKILVFLPVLKDSSTKLGEWELLLWRQHISQSFHDSNISSLLLHLLQRCDGS